MQDAATVNEQVIRPIGVTEALKYRLRKQHEIIEGFSILPIEVFDFHTEMSDIYFNSMRFIDNIVRHGK